MANSLTIVGQEKKTPDRSSSERPLGFRGRAAVVTLGCAKNQVDSEVMLGVLHRAGYELVRDVEAADVAVVNTCGFLESSTQESIDCILDLAELKKNGRLRRLVVAGCLVSRHGDDLKDSLPEVDRFLTTEQITKVDQAVSEGEFQSILNEAQRPYFLYDDTTPRFLSGKKHTAYVKVAEGCNRPCTFCIIPQIRGPMRSRTVDSVVREVIDLGQQGVQEINLVAQDLTSYGLDIKGEGLPTLLRKLDAARAVRWIRLLYAYPVGTELELLDAIRELPTVCNYLDIPLQHASERVLKEMRRPLGRYAPVNLVEQIRGYAPEIKIRTTFIVGFPGETEDDVKQLENFISAGHFSSVGIFSYSPERGTPAAEMDNQVPPELQEERRGRLMEAQQKVVARTLATEVGKRFDVLVEGAHHDTDLLLVGRTEFQAPEVDGTVLINDVSEELGDVVPGEMGVVEITEVAGYDLVGSLVSYDGAKGEHE